MLLFEVVTREKRPLRLSGLLYGGTAMQTKEQVFKEIQHIMQHDYVDFPVALQQTQQHHVTNQMTDEQFVYVIEDYLAGFKDENLYLTVKNSVRPNIGFRVRRHENVLYIIEASQETRLHKGDQIIAIDGVSIEEASEKFHKQLVRDKAERQNWSEILMRATSVTVKQRNVSIELILSSYARKHYEPTYKAKMMNEQTLYMKFTDFADESAVRKLVSQYEHRLANIQHVIIDVRENYGGNDAFYFPLLDWLFEREYTMKELQENDTMFTNYTSRNCELMIELLEHYIEPGMNAAIEQMIEREIFLMEQHRGQGMIEVSEDLDVTIEGRSQPQAIYVLTDTHCGSPGETFVAYAKKSPKVTVVGRATMGIMATCNVVMADFGDIALNYSMSKMNEASELASTDGIQPHVYVPWTPEHLHEDVDLAVVQALISQPL